MPSAFILGDFVTDLWRYQVDFWQRNVLFWDTLRERANQMLAHEQAGFPPVLNFSTSRSKLRGISDPHRIEVTDCWLQRSLKFGFQFMHGGVEDAR